MTPLKNFLLCYLISSACGSWMDEPEYWDVKDEECRTSGVQCGTGCHEVIYCRQAGGNKVVIETCPSGTFCNPKDGDACSATSCSILPLNPEPLCSDEGFFPDPFNCNKSVYCDEPLKTPIMECECPAGQSYNPSKDSCEEPKSGCCWEGTIACTNGGEEGVINECYPDICYFCILDEDHKSYRPMVSKDCSQFFDSNAGGYAVNTNSDGTKAHGTCSAYQTSTSTPNTSEPTTETTNPTTETTNPTTETPTPTTETTAPTTIPPPICGTPGQMIADSTDCHRYYKCNANLHPERRTCPTGTYFVCPSQGPLCGCTVGTCDNNSTDPVTCNQAGQMISDTSDCHRYFKCNVNLQPELRTCPGGTFFDCPSQSLCGCTVGNC